MISLPQDIKNEIHKRATSPIDAEELLEKCIQIRRASINAGEFQLIRSMLIISNFDKTKFQAFIDNGFNGDPRDIIMEAQQMKSQFNYGINKFE